ncbi:hypothetical protein HNR34_001862 [Geobacillus subterraneus]
MLTTRINVHPSHFALYSSIMNKRSTQKIASFPPIRWKEALSSYDWLLSLAFKATDTVVSKPSR